MNLFDLNLSEHLKSVGEGLGERLQVPGRVDSQNPFLSQSSRVKICEFTKDLSQTKRIFRLLSCLEHGVFIRRCYIGTFFLFSASLYFLM